VDVYSFALTVVQFALRGKKDLCGFLYDIWIEHSQSRRFAQGTMSRVLHKLQADNWRPKLEDLTRPRGENIEGWTDIPFSIANLVVMCWSSDPQDRPTFEEIFE
jgi:hypothetical protein